MKYKQYENNARMVKWLYWFGGALDFIYEAIK